MGERRGKRGGPWLSLLHSRSPAPAPARRSESQSFSSATGTSLVPDADLRDMCLINPVTSVLACEVKCPQRGHAGCLLSECLNELPSSAPHQLTSTLRALSPSSQ